MLKYILLLTSMTLAITGQFFLKKGIDASTLSANASSIVQTILTPSVFIGFAMYGISSIVWLFVLQKFPLSVAYPTLALSYIIVVFLSFIFLKEPLTVNKIIGSFIIVTGVFVLFHK